MYTLLEAMLTARRHLKPLQVQAEGGSFTALELGTYLGYSAVRVARRLPPTGSLYSVESDLQSQTVARQVLELAQLLERVTLLAGTAEAQTAELRRRRLQFAFVFIDHKKQETRGDTCDAGLLRPKAVVVADNVGLMEINDYAEHVRSSGSYLSASVASEVEYFTEDERGPLSDAMEVSVYLGENSQRELAADSSQLDPSRWDFSGGSGRRTRTNESYELSYARGLAIHSAVMAMGLSGGFVTVTSPRPSLWCSSLHHVQRARRHGDVVVPEPYSRWLWHSCGQFSLMTYGAAAHRRWGCCFLSFLVLLAGLNYWREATVGFRRRIDMLAVAVTVMYHSCVAFGVLGNGLDAPPTALLCHPVRPFLGPSTPVKVRHVSDGSPPRGVLMAINDQVNPWKGLRSGFTEHLENTKSKGAASLEGVVREHARDAAQERLLDNDTPEGKQSYERWCKAQNAHHQVVEALRQRSFRMPEEGGRGRKATEEAVKVFFPEEWCHLLSEDEVLAELVVDCAVTKIVEDLLDASVGLLEFHEGWHLPASHKMWRMHSSPQLASSPLTAGARVNLSQSPKSIRETLTQPDLPPRWRQRLDGKSRSADVSSDSAEVSTIAQAPRIGAPTEGRTLKHFRSSRPFDPFLVRLYGFTESQRPQRRLKRTPSDPLAPKWSFPTTAENFPQQWPLWRMGCPPVKVGTPVATQKSMSNLDEEEEDEAPPGYTWLLRKTRDGQTVFPYSLASHRAFFESYKDPELKAKAMAVARALSQGLKSMCHEIRRIRLHESRLPSHLWKMPREIPTIFHH
eukprot:g19309.t1